MLLPAIFPTQAELGRATLLMKYAMLYDNKAFEVLGLNDAIKKQFKDQNNILYIAHAIPSKISDFYGDFVLGKPEDFAIESSVEEQNKQIQKILDDNDLGMMVNDYGVEQSAYGYTVLLGYKDATGKYVIQKVPQDQYFPQRDGSIIFASLIVKPNARDPKREVWLYVQQYAVEGGSCKLERSLWEVNSMMQKSEKVNLSLYDATLLESEDLHIPAIPVAVIPNGRGDKYGMGKSDYKDILPQLAEVNERTTHVAIQLLKNLSARMTLPRGIIKEENGKKVVDAFEYVEIADKDTHVPTYITNDNPLLADTRSHVESQARFISWVSAVPMFELLQTAAPESEESLRTRLFGATRRTDSKRSAMRMGLDWIVRIGLMFNGVSKPDKLTVKFSSVIPVNAVAQAQSEEMYVNAGISSRKSAMKRVFGFDDAAADAEQAVIEEENARAGLSPAANTPAL